MVTVVSGAWAPKLDSRELAPLLRAWQPETTGQGQIPSGQGFAVKRDKKLCGSRRLIYCDMRVESRCVKGKLDTSTRLIQMITRKER